MNISCTDEYHWRRSYRNFRPAHKAVCYVCYGSPVCSCPISSEVYFIPFPSTGASFPPSSFPLCPFSYFPNRAKQFKVRTHRPSAQLCTQAFCLSMLRPPCRTCHLSFRPNLSFPVTAAGLSVPCTTSSSTN